MRARGLVSATLLLLVSRAVATEAAGAQGEEVPERQCAARKADSSVVCVCNETYCDNVVRTAPPPGQYVLYTTSESGLRFKKTTGPATNSSADQIASLLAVASRVVLAVNTSAVYQRVEGFGGAVTDSAAINWRNLSAALQHLLIQSYFGSSGLEYNMIRVPIGGSDFSTHPYAYNELPLDDVKLSNFSLTVEDTEYKLPMLKAALAAAHSEVHVVATTWSPPPWMKTNRAWSGESRLETQYYQTYADYHLKFLQQYLARGVKVWAVTTTNEPVNGVIPLAHFNSLGWTPATQSKWIVENLGPTLRRQTESDISDVKILAVDDQRYTVPLWMHKMVSFNSSVLDYISGVAVHFYGDFVPASLISWTHDHYPQLFILATEGCEGSYPWNLRKVVLGSWSRAANYVSDIIQDLNHWVVGWIDWNLCLNARGGPNWAENFVDSPVIVFPERQEFLKQPMFYAMGHFSKFLPRHSARVASSLESVRSVEHVAFTTPRGTLVLVLYNSELAKKKVDIVVDGARHLAVRLPSHSFATVELSLS